jgi:hypothetical protein
MFMLCSVQVYDDAVADVSSGNSSSSSNGANVMQQLDCASYFARGLVLLARQKVYTYIHTYTCNAYESARIRIVQYTSACIRIFCTPSLSKV